MKQHNKYNKYCFLSSKLAYYNYFRRIKTGVMTLKSLLCITGINYILIYIYTNRKTFILNCNNISSAVKRLNAYKIKVFVCIICVCSTFIYYAYINAHTSMYIFRNMLRLYIKYIIYMNINIYMSILSKYMLYVCLIYVNAYNIYNKYTQSTQIYNVNKNSYFECE